MRAAQATKKTPASGADVGAADEAGARSEPEELEGDCVYGLGAYGQAGVAKALEILREELDVAMALTGVTDASNVPRDLILNPPPRGRDSDERGTFEAPRVYERQ